MISGEEESLDRVNPGEKSDVGAAMAEMEERLEAKLMTRLMERVAEQGTSKGPGKGRSGREGKHITTLYG